MNEDQGTNPPDNTDEAAGSDPVKQLKGEFTRKTSAISTQLAEMQKSQQQLAALLSQAMAPPPPKAGQQDNDLEKLMYSDNAKYRETIKNDTKREIMAEISYQNESQRSTQTVIAELAAEYPELSDSNAELTKKAVSILNALPERDRTTVTAYRYAVKEAAEQLSMKPRSKRDPDEFAGPSYTNYNSRRREKSEKQIIADLAPLASAMGLDLSDEKVQKRVAERAKRNFTQLDSPMRIRKGK